MPGTGRTTRGNCEKPRENIEQGEGEKRKEKQERVSRNIEHTSMWYDN